MKRLLAFFIMSLLVFGITGVATATLWDRGGGLIFDSDLNVTWLQDANATGYANWEQAKDWASNLQFGGYSDWRLPTVDEMSHLFYNELGGTISTPIALSADPDLKLFRDIAPDDYANKIDAYWSQTEVERDKNFAWVFGFNNSYQSGTSFQEYKWVSYGHAWGVIDGDISPAPVPEPATILLLGVGLIGLAGYGRK